MISGKQRQTSLQTAKITFFERLKQWAKTLKCDLHALALAMWDPRVPPLAKFIAFFVVAYALSPIDLIPDFIPVLGYLDELILLPAGLWLAISLIPAAVLAEHRASAHQAQLGPQSVGRSRWIGAIFVILTWIIASMFIIWMIWG